METTSFAIGLAGPILIALVGFTIFAAEVRSRLCISLNGTVEGSATNDRYKGLRQGAG